MQHLKTASSSDKLLKEVVIAATGGQTFKQATREISEREKESLSRAIGKDVDLWRADFAQALRRTGTKLLQRLEDSIDDIKPDALAYSLAVVADKAAALDGRNQVNAASVNIQVNNYGSASKEELLAALNGTLNAVSKPLVTQLDDEGRGTLQGCPTTLEVESTPETTSTPADLTPTVSQGETGAKQGENGV